MAKEKRKGKGRFEFSWQPELCWQILRRTPDYKEAYNDFIESAKENKDSGSIGFVKLYSKDQCSFDEESVKGRNLIFQSLIQLDLWDEGPKKNWKRFYELQDYTSEHRFNFKTDYYIRFYQRYGDILRFPIDPDCVVPEAGVLNTIWMYNPVKPISLDYLSQLTGGDESIQASDFVIEPHRKKTPNYGKNSSKVRYHIIAVNENHPPRTIINAVKNYFDIHFEIKKAAGKSFGWHLDDLFLMLEIFDFEYAETILGKALSPKNTIHNTSLANSKLDYRSKVNALYERRRTMKKLMTILSRKCFFRRQQIQKKRGRRVFA